MIPISLLLVGSHRIEVGALGGILGGLPNLVVIGTASTAGEALSVAEFHPPDVAVIDTLLGADDALELTDRLIRLHPDVGAVVLIDGEDAAQALRAVLAGAAAVAVKPVPVDILADLIWAVAAGETHIPPRLLTGVIRVLRAGIPADGWTERQVSEPVVSGSSSA